MSGYPISAYRQLFPDGAQTPPFDPAEDGDHYQPDPNFFEWWYFDVAFEDGSYLVAILHSSLYNAADHKPTLDLRYYPAEGPPVVAIARFDRSAYRATSDRCHVRIGDCVAVDEGDRYRLSLHHELMTAELTFWPQLPGWKAGTGHLFADQASGHHFDWVVPLPRARVEGTLTVNGQQRTVAGVGYHDHNWGNLYLPAAFSYWTWGRVLAGDWTVIFGDVVGRGKAPPHVTPFMLARGDEILLATDRIQVNGKGLTREPRTGAGYYHRLHLTTLDGMPVRLTLTVRQTIEALDFAAPRSLLARQRHLRGAAEVAFYLAQRAPGVGRLAAWLLGKGSYLRLEADYRLDLPDHDVVETGQALYEVMLLE
ncbi:MAG: carotenoid 1,2-hydratase [Chloroflexi bacterium]|nr:carotenoid 1,2-hydratase [Chloroflexota bacterium]